MTGWLPRVDTKKVVMVKGGVKLSTELKNLQFTGENPGGSRLAYTFQYFRGTLPQIAEPHILLKGLGLYPVERRLAAAVYSSLRITARRGYSQGRLLVG
jgi:hypothetical protein